MSWSGSVAQACLKVNPTTARMFFAEVLNNGKRLGPERAQRSRTTDYPAGWGHMALMSVVLAIEVTDMITVPVITIAGFLVAWIIAAAALQIFNAQHEGPRDNPSLRK